MAVTIRGGLTRRADGTYINGKGEPVDLDSMKDGDLIAKLGGQEYTRLKKEGALPKRPQKSKRKSPPPEAPEVPEDPEVPVGDE